MNAPLRLTDLRTTEAAALLALRPAGGFRFIKADPPWPFMVRSPKGHNRSPERHYATMSLEAICAMPVGQLAAKDCLLWLWATHPLLHRAYAVVEAWGFEPVTGGEWLKTMEDGSPVAGTGYWLRGTGEPYILAKRGRPRVLVRDIPGTFAAPRREHSRKPELAYEHAERMGAAPRLDLFSRQQRPGWTAFGNQVGLFDGGPS